MFIKRNEIPKPGFNIGLALRRTDTPGQIGIEIEVEGKNLPEPTTIPDPWKYVHDGSLRGQENAEYVLKKPINFDKVTLALSKLWGRFEAVGSVFDDSNRTSVHVHLNVQKFHFNQLASLFALYITFEEVLTQWCGDHRVGNLFCLRAKDAPAIVTQLKKFIRSDGSYQVEDHHHYAGMNGNALHKYGSLEFRALRGVSDRYVIEEWVDVLKRLYDLSQEMADPRDICNLFSAEGPMAFFDTILGPSASGIRLGCGMSEEAIRDSMYDGIRMAQDICYSRDWDLFKAVTIRPDPFGRSTDKVASRIMKAAQAAPQMAQAMTYANEGPEILPEYYEDEVEDEDMPPAQPAPQPVTFNTVSLSEFVSTPNF